MCSRLIYAEKVNDIARWLECDPARIFEPRFNIAPTQWVISVRYDSQRRLREVVPLRWGLLPPWATELSVGNKMVNARSESVFEKASFRNAIRRRRCLVPVSGFYEWQRDGKARRPYLIRRPDRQPFALAGIWEHNEAVPEGPVQTLSILTTSANAVMQPLHDRMPVIVPEGEFARWLNPSIEDDEIKTLFRPALETELQLQRVSEYVNNATHEGPECIAPPTPETETPSKSSKRTNSKDAPGQDLLFDT